MSFKTQPKIDLENHDFEQYKKLSIDEISEMLIRIPGYRQIESILKEMNIIPADFNSFEYLLKKAESADRGIKDNDIETMITSCRALIRGGYLDDEIKKRNPVVLSLMDAMVRLDGNEDYYKY